MRENITTIMSFNTCGKSTLLLLCTFGTVGLCALALKQLHKVPEMPTISQENKIVLMNDMQKTFELSKGCRLTNFNGIGIMDHGEAYLSLYKIGVNLNTTTFGLGTDIAEQILFDGGLLLPPAMTLDTFFKGLYFCEGMIDKCQYIFAHSDQRHEYYLGNLVTRQFEIITEQNQPISNMVVVEVALPQSLAQKLGSGEVVASTALIALSGGIVLGVYNFLFS